MHWNNETFFLYFYILRKRTMTVLRIFHVGKRNYGRAVKWYFLITKAKEGAVPCPVRY